MYTQSGSTSTVGNTAVGHYGKIYNHPLQKHLCRKVSGSINVTTGQQNTALGWMQLQACNKVLATQQLVKGGRSSVSGSSSATLLGAKGRSNAPRAQWKRFCRIPSCGAMVVVGQAERNVVLDIETNIKGSTNVVIGHDHAVQLSGSSNSNIIMGGSTCANIATEMDNAVIIGDNAGYRLSGTGTENNGTMLIGYTEEDYSNLVQEML